MKNFILLFVLTIFVTNSVYPQFSSDTKIQADRIENNTGTDILLDPTDKVDINYFTGSKALQSTDDGELEESAVTNTELGHLTGATSNIQNQIDAKQPIITGTDGDLLYWNSGLSNLGIGTNGQVLQVSALGFPEWADIVAVSVTTKGDIQTYSTQPDRLPVGTDGQLLSADSLEATGLKWIDAPSTSPTTTIGDLIYNNTGTAAGDTRLAIGTEDQLLTVKSGIPSWENAPISVTVQNAGDLQSHDGTSPNTFAAPAASNQFLVSDLNETYKMKWSDSITGLVSQAHMVGTAKQEPATNCIYSVGSSGSFTAPPTQPLCNDFQVTGDITFPDLKQPQFTIDNARTDGVYVVRVGAVIALNFEAVNAVGEAKLNIDGEQVDFVQVIKSSQSAYIRNYRLQGFKRFTTGGDKLVQITMKTSVGNTNPMIITNRPANDNLFFTVEFYPDSNSLAAIQNKTLTAETANSFSFQINLENGFVTQEDFNVIDGNCTSLGGAGARRCNWISGIFTETPNCVATIVGSNETYQYEYFTSGITSFDIRTFDGTTPANSTVNFNCSKQGADVNKSQVIAGTFENINSSDLDFVRVGLSGNQTISTSNITKIEFDTIISDERNLFDETTNYRFTADKAGIYLVNLVGQHGSITTNELFYLKVYKNGSVYDETSGTSGTTSNNMNLSSLVQLDAGDYLEFYTDSIADTSYTVNSTAYRTSVTIQQLPDTESIIKNLNDNNNFECQTKILASDQNSDGVMLTFNNLVVGKKYMITGEFYCIEAAFTNQSNRSCILNAVHNGNTIASDYFEVSYNGAISPRHRIGLDINEYFTASATTLTIEAAGLAQQIISASSDGRKQATLCELPDNYIINSTKFN